MLFFTFYVSNLIMFYLFFECSLIPIFLIILGWGYQPERLKASLSLFFYTLYASLPLLVLLFMLINSLNYNLFKFTPLENSMYMFFSDYLFMVFIMLAFLVKFPMYYFHMWLPKAHVEAPVSGSMLLAGVLLKLGGYGLIRMSLFFSSTPIFKFVLSMSLMGSALLSFICLTQSDLKVLIAYSSVVHMGLVIMGFLSLYMMGIEGGLIIMVAHGFCSSAMFAGANMMYERSHSRSFMLNSGYMTNMPEFSLMWFIITMMNFGGPFTYNLLGELILIVGMMFITMNCMFVVLILSLVSAIYSFILYLSTQQGNYCFFFFSSMKMKSSEMNSLLSHLWAMLLMLMSSSLV